MTIDQDVTRYRLGFRGCGLGLLSMAGNADWVGNMNEWILFAAVVLLIVYFLLKRRPSLATEDAKRSLSEGAILIDVRSPGEYADGKVKGALNVPVDQLEKQAGNVVPDKSTPIFLHCASGIRSAKGVGILKRLGYQEVYNLGSFAHARKVVGG